MFISPPQYRQSIFGRFFIQANAPFGSTPKKTKKARGQVLKKQGVRSCNQAKEIDGVRLDRF
jgi:hypothetical protein